MVRRNVAWTLPKWVAGLLCDLSTNHTVFRDKEHQSDWRSRPARGPDVVFRERRQWRRPTTLTVLVNASCVVPEKALPQSGALPPGKIRHSAVWSVVCGGHETVLGSSRCPPGPPATFEGLCYIYALGFFAPSLLGSCRKSKTLRLAWTLIGEQLPSYVGLYAFEKLCREWVLVKARANEMPFMPERVGSDWSPEAQADVVAINWRLKQILLGEARWTRARTSRDIVLRLASKTKTVVPDGAAG